MVLNHIGYITETIEDTRSDFVSLGYCAGNIVDFPAHKCRVCFLKRDGEIIVELVEPYEENKSLRKLASRGVAPYHLCYEVDNIDESSINLQKLGYVPLSEPVAAPAFDNRRICYFWGRGTGYIELLSKY